MGAGTTREDTASHRHLSALLRWTGVAAIRLVRAVTLTAPWLFHRANATLLAKHVNSSDSGAVGRRGAAEDRRGRCHTPPSAGALSWRCAVVLGLVMTGWAHGHQQGGGRPALQTQGSFSSPR